MILQAFVVGRLQANCYVVGDEESREVIVIDPGDQGEALLREFQQRDCRVEKVLATHHHLDHTGGVHEVLEACPDARFAIHREDYPWIAETAPTAPFLYGHEITVPRAPDIELSGGEVVEVGRHRFEVLHTPGHTPGSLCLYGDGPDGETVVFTGDTLFRGSIGRHDFPGSDGHALLTSIKRRLLTLPEETIVYPGHGDPSRIGTERDENPFLVNPRATLGFDVE